MRKRLTAALFSLGFMGSALAASDAIDIPFTRFTLANGLTAIVHEDHKAPVVAVSASAWNAACPHAARRTQASVPTKVNCQDSSFALRPHSHQELQRNADEFRFF